MDDQIVVDVVVEHAGHGQLHALHRVVVHGHLIAHVQVAALHQAAADDALVHAGKVDGFVAAVQVDAAVQRAVADDQVHLLGLVAVGHVRRALVHEAHACGGIT